MEIYKSYEIDLDDMFEEHLINEYNWRKEDAVNDPDDFIHEFEDVQEFIYKHSDVEWSYFMENFSEGFFDYLIDVLKKNTTGNSDISLDDIFNSREKWVPFFYDTNSILVAKFEYRGYSNYFEIGIKEKYVPDWSRIEEKILSGDFLKTLNKNSDLNSYTGNLGFYDICFGEFMDALYEEAEMEKMDEYYCKPKEFYFREISSDIFEDSDFDFFRKDSSMKDPYKSLSEKLRCFNEIDFYSTVDYKLNDFRLVSVEKNLFGISFGENVQLIAEHKEEGLIEIKDWEIKRKTFSLLNTNLKKIKDFETENNLTFLPVSFDTSGASLFLADETDGDNKRYCVCVNFFTGEHTIIFKVDTDDILDEPLEFAKRFLKGGTKEIFTYAISA